MSSNKSQMVNSHSNGMQVLQNNNNNMKQQQQQQHVGLLNTVANSQAQQKALTHYPTIPLTQLHHANLAAVQHQQQSQSLIQPHAGYIQYPTVYSPNKVRSAIFFNYSK